MGAQIRSNKKNKLMLYQKFALSIIAFGLIPVVLLSVFINHNLIKNDINDIKNSYTSSAQNISCTMETMLDTYNMISKMPYYYDENKYVDDGEISFKYDYFTQLIYGLRYEEDQEKEKRISIVNYLQNMCSTDKNLVAVHFIAIEEDNEKKDYHYSSQSTYFKGENGFENDVNYKILNKSSTKLQIAITHDAEYFGGINNKVLTVGRNYFNICGSLANKSYVGTLYLDIDIDGVSKIIDNYITTGDYNVYIVTDDNMCIYSNVSDRIGKNVEISSQQDLFYIESKNNSYGIRTVLEIDKNKAFSNIALIRQLLIVLIGALVLILIYGSFFFSKKLTMPIREMIRKVDIVGSGNFDVHFEEESNTEIGILESRFNNMQKTLQEYINQSYVLKLRQNEAELTALKSQIYPHFLYNTLEIIRMTALEDENSQVPQMIEALAAQIHYLIGPVKDKVPMTAEVDMIKKYIYLLNCRIAGEITLEIDGIENTDVLVPRLLLQPIVENAYVHGLKENGGTGTIKIEMCHIEEELEISILDNGKGMTGEQLEVAITQLNGSDFGIRNKNNWQSIGLQNVQQRIKYMYGEQYGITITSSERIGTMVTIRLPYDRKGGTDQ